MVTTTKDRLPSQVKAFINGASSDRLKTFELSSFMAGPPLADVFETIDKRMKFFSVYIAKEHLSPDLWEDSRYVDIEKPVSTYIFRYDSKNQFIFHREEKSLWLNFSDLIGNFKIDRKESKCILDGVNEILS